MVSEEPIRMTTPEERELLIQKHRHGVVFVVVVSVVFAVLTAGAAYLMWPTTDDQSIVWSLCMAGMGVLVVGLLLWVSYGSLHTANSMTSELPVHLIQGELHIGSKGLRRIDGRPVQPLGSWSGGIHSGDRVEGEVVFQPGEYMGVLLEVWLEEDSTDAVSGP